MPIDLEQVKNHYAKMDNARLENIAKFEMALLEPAVQQIVIAEIKRRGLDENLLVGIEAQTKELSEAEVYALRDKIKGLACPSCGQPNQGLMGGMVRKVRSFLIITQYEQRPMIACPACVEAERKSQLIKNSLLGWWGFPWGLLYRTPQAIINHFRDNGKKEEISEGILIQFAVENIGELKTNWDKADKLVNFIRRQNNKPV